MAVEAVDAIVAGVKTVAESDRLLGGAIPGIEWQMVEHGQAADNGCCQEECCNKKGLFHRLPAGSEEHDISRPPPAVAAGAVQCSQKVSRSLRSVKRRGY